MLSRNKSWKRLCGAFLIVLLTVLCTTACAPVATAPQWEPCRHPLIDPSSDHGVYRALQSYQLEIDHCNALNGIGDTP